MQIRHLRYRPLAALVAALGLSWAANPVSADLVGYWDFNDASDPAVALDSSGFNNHGTVSGNAVYTDDGGGFSGEAGDRAMDMGAFNNQARVEIESAANGAFDSITESDEATIAFWMFGNAEQPVSQWTFFFGEGGTRRLGSHAPWGDGNIYFDVGDCCGSDERISTAMPETAFEGKWTHMAYVKDNDETGAGTTTIYIDGVPFHSSEPGVIGDIRPINNGFIGSGPNGGSSQSGLMDDFAIWDEALPEGRIALLSTGERPDTPPVELPGDFNEDGTIDLADYEILKSNFRSGKRLHEDGNINFRRSVDLEDFIDFAAAFNSFQQGGAPVPEPSTWALALLSLVSLWGLRARRRR